MKVGKHTAWLPRIVLFLSLAIVLTAISVCRIVLTSANPVQIGLLFPKETSNKNLIISILVFVLLTTADFIHLNFCNKRLKDEWEKVKDRGIKEEIEFYGNLDGSYKFLYGTLTFILFITTIIFLGRSLVDNTQLNIAMNIALRKDLILAIEISIIFQVLISSCSFICSLCVDKTKEEVEN